MDIYKLDRIEEGIAAVENPDGVMLYVSAARFPKDAKSGDCFTFEKGSFFLCQIESEKRRKAIASLLDDIVEK